MKTKPNDSKSYSSKKTKKIIVFLFITFILFFIVKEVWKLNRPGYLEIKKAIIERAYSLDLSNKGLKTLPPEIANIQHLVFLDLSNNNLTELPPEIANIQYLQLLDLSNNNLTELPPEIARLENLERLNLHGNDSFSIKNLCEIFADYPKPIYITSAKNLVYIPYILQIKISPNQTSLPPEIAKITNLESLSLWSCQITNLPEEMVNLKNLRHLVLANDKLTSLPPTILKLKQLEFLYLYYNELSSLPPEIGNLTNLTDLSLKDNNLTTLPKEIANLTNLRYLNLSGNDNLSIQSVVKIFKNFPVPVSITHSKYPGPPGQRDTLRIIISEDSPSTSNTTPKKLEISDKNIDDYNEPLTIADKMPYFTKGGEEGLRKYIAKHIEYPSLAQENSIQGTVFVRFVIEKDGSIGEIQITRGVDPLLDQEAVRVVKSLPKFKPGYQDGRPVPVWYSIPIVFKLDN